MATRGGAGTKLYLALELYFECQGRVPSNHDERVVRLSEMLRRLPYHVEAARKESFRNPDGVVFKLMNLRNVATGSGLGNTSRMDQEVWGEFGTDPARTKSAADLIRRSLAMSVEFDMGDDDTEVEFHEGRIVTRLHIGRERSPRLRKELLRKRRKKGRLVCDTCSASPVTGDDELDEAMFEAHHIIPLAVAATERKTRVSDMALLCASCHRIIHELIAREGRWVVPQELKELLQARGA